MKTRRISFRIFALLLSLLAGAVLGEITVRLTGAAPDIVRVRHEHFQLSDNPKLAYEPIPGAKIIVENSPGTPPDRANTMGFRDIDHPVRKPAGVFRIIVIGDSIAEGVYIDSKRHTFPSLLQKRLDPDAATVEIINFGVAGYDTEQEAEMLRVRGLAMKPDLVIVAYCLNDRFHVDGGILEELHRAERNRGAVNRYGLNRFFIRSALYRFFRFRVFREDPLNLRVDQLEQMDTLKDDSVDSGFAALQAMSESHGFKTLVVVFPNFRQLEPYPFHEEHEAIRKMALDHGFLFLDLLDGYRRYAKAHPDEKLDFDFIHPTATGHRLAAEMIARYLTTNHLVPDTGSE